MTAMRATDDDDFSDMRRADEPLEEERRALQIICGAVGLLVGSRFLGSALLGLTFGIASAGALLSAGGTTGLWAREIGWQASQFAESRSLPQFTESAVRMAKTVGDATLAELKVLSDLEPVKRSRVQISAAAQTLWSRLRAWADSSGVTERLRAAWRASHMEDWYERAKQNIEQRRRAQGLA